MDQVTQQNAAMVEESTAASHTLSQETEELTRLIGRFQVGEIETPRKPQARGAEKIAARALKTVGVRGGAAPKMKAADVDAAADMLKTVDSMVMQFEIPIETVYYCVSFAKKMAFAAS